MTIVFVCGLHGERLNPAFALQRHNAPTAGVMVWGAIACTVAPSIDAWHHDIPQPPVLPLMQRLSGTIFQQDNARPHSAMVPQDCLRTGNTHSWPARFVSNQAYLRSFGTASWAPRV
ncbi:transposable element Tcb2 transposase [Trichonephila clavipes]|uniref:Transposable element Tcb2 transposase n=1 Tax=Trichonephila clavipes TaxID=2585209 RepID=A0A8X6WBV0_TRICX|nr:transposable element Tcb2 transposase [Trichonephila clavipes]